MYISHIHVWVCYIISEFQKQFKRNYRKCFIKMIAVDLEFCHKKTIPYSNAWDLSEKNLAIPKFFTL